MRNMAVGLLGGFSPPRSQSADAACDYLATLKRRLVTCPDCVALTVFRLTTLPGRPKNRTPSPSMTGTRWTPTHELLTESRRLASTPKEAANHVERFGRCLEEHRDQRQAAL